MGYFQVRYDSRVINYDRRGFIGLATGLNVVFYISVNSLQSSFDRSVGRSDWFMRCDLCNTLTLRWRARAKLK